MRLLIGSVFFVLSYFQTEANPYSLYEENGKIGLKNQQGDVIIPASYEALGWSEGNLTAAGSVIGYKLNGLWGLINLSNQRVTTPQYFSLTRGDHDLLVAIKRSPLTFRMTAGCIDTSGKEIIPFDYSGIKIIDLRAVVFILDDNKFKYGVIDLNNKILIPIQFRTITPIGSLRFAVENFDRKTALYNDVGKPVTSFVIDSISSFQNDRAIVYQNAMRGLINRDGVIVHQPKYREIKLTNGKIAAQLPNTWYMLTGQNKALDTLRADSVVQLDLAIFKIVNGNISALVNENFKPITARKFSYISPFKNNRATVRVNNNAGVIDSRGEEILACQFREVILNNDHILAEQQVGNKTEWLIFDKYGAKKTFRNYDQILPLTNGIFCAKKKGYWGGLDEFGKEIIACVYDTILDIKNNQVAVKFKGQYGIINRQEDWLVIPQYNKVQLLNADRYFEKSGEMLFLKSFTNYTYYFTINPVQVNNDGIIERTSYGATWTVNFDGQIIKREEPHEEPVQQVYEASEGLRGIKKDGKFGFIDNQGRLRIANRYEAVKPFSDGLAAIKIRNRWGFINHDEHIVIQPTYEEVDPFAKGYSLVKQKGQFGLIDKTGNEILPTRYDAITILDTKRFLLSTNNMVGLADEHGNIILQPKYENIVDLDNGYLIVQQYGKVGLVTTQGLSTIPLQYDEIKFDRVKDRYLALKKSEWIEL